MPFGLCNAPATFERLMDHVFEGLPWITALVSLDDIVVHSRTVEEHLNRLEDVFNVGLKLSPDKCHFLKIKCAIWFIFSVARD